jgi:flagellar assembly protein FliH
VTNSSSDGAGRRRPAVPPAGAYARFIPREELHSFEAWTPGALHGADAVAAPARDEPSPPTATELEARVAAARQAGYQDGYRDGLVALDSFKQSYASQLATQFAQLVDGFERETAALDARLAETVAATAVQLARQVLRSELQADPARVAGVAAEAVDAVLASARRIALHLNPADVALVAAARPEPLQAREVRLVADDSIERGGCRVESDLGAVDARIATRWAQASAALGVELPWGAPEAAA